MKHRHLLLICFVACSLCAEPIYLLGSPRSGTYWLAYILQGITGRPIRHDSDPFRNPYLQHIINPRLPYILKTHLKTELEKRPYHPHAKLVMIIRNHRESQLRHRKLDYNIAVPEFVRHAQLNGMYFQNIQFFESWDTKRRHCIFYEDLILHPQEEILKLAHFLNAKEHLVTDFIKKLDNHISQSYQLKQQRKTPIPTKGTDKLVYYSKRIPLELNKEMDDAVREYQPKVWEKYLKRYEWKNDDK